MKIVVEISDDDAMHINRVIELANNSDAKTRGMLGCETLTRMLLQDVALAIRRPGSWEGANMAQVLASHSYEI
jgi:hypothetical protein